MDQGLIPRRYAKALFKAAAERGVEKRLYSLCGALAAAFASEPRLNATVANPFVAGADKIRLLETASGATPDDTLMADFLKLLTENRRLDMIRDIAIAYRLIYRQANNIRHVTVTSAAPLPEAQEKRLKEIIAAHLDGATMEYSSKVDPSLIGGFTVDIDNERLNASVSHELKQLKLSLIKR